MFVLALTALVVFSLMHQIPSAYIVAQTVCYLNEAMRQSCILNRHASMLVLLHYAEKGALQLYLVKWTKSAEVVLMYVAQTTVETTTDFECGRGISFSSMVKSNYT